MSTFSSCQNRAASFSVLGCVVFICVTWLNSFVLAAAADDTSPPSVTSTVGMAKRMDSLVLPGAKLKVKPMNDRHQPFVLRILEVYPYGTDHRYDLEFYALEPGE